MYSIYSKSLLFTTISYVQESFQLNEINYAEKCFSVSVHTSLAGGFPLTYNIIWF